MQAGSRARAAAAGRTKGWTAALLLVVCALGCARPNVTAIPPFREGVGAASQQTQQAFGDANVFLRERQIDRAVRQPTLSDASFVTVISSENLARWSRAFAAMESYAAKLSELLDPGHRQEVEAELRQLGEQLQVQTGEQFPPGVAGGFVSLGGLLVEIKAGQDAMTAIRNTDPAVQETFALMAHAVGEDNQQGVRGTVQSSWTVYLAGMSTEFLRAGSEGEKRAIVRRYVQAMDERDAHDRSLAALRESYLALARAHGDLARGDRVSAAALIRIVQQEYAAARKEIEHFRELRDRAAGSVPAGAGNRQ